MNSLKNIIQQYACNFKYKKVDFYKSIDFLPIFNFFKVIETNDYRYILKLKDYEKLPKRINLSELETAWNKMYNDFGNSEKSNRAIINFIIS